MRQTFFFIAMLTIGTFTFPWEGQAAGPWKAQIVDAETGKPLEGVVVLAYWIKYTSSWAGWAGPEFYDAEEVVTGPDGRFVIQARGTWTLLPWTKIEGNFVIFKPGYGKWRIRDWDKKPPDWEDLSTAEVFEKDGIVLEMLPLKTRQQRLEYYQTPGRTPPGLVPAERMRHFQEAENAERAYLGFRN